METNPLCWLLLFFPVVDPIKFIDIFSKMAYSLLSEMHSWLHKLTPCFGEAERGKRVLRLAAIVSYTLRWWVNFNCMRPVNTL